MNTVSYKDLVKVMQKYQTIIDSGYFGTGYSENEEFIASEIMNLTRTDKDYIAARLFDVLDLILEQEGWTIEKGGRIL